MLRWTVVVVATATVLSVPAVASADPVAPQSDTPCSSHFADAMAFPPDARIPVECVDRPDMGFQWQTVTSPYPMSDRWLTYGPETKLYGDGRRGSNLNSGDWLATPQDAITHCRAEQLAVIPGEAAVGPPRIDEGAAGQPLSLQVVPMLFSIQMSGYCLWTKVVT